MKLGEFRLFSVGASSVNARGIELAIFVGDEDGPLEIRRGGTLVDISVMETAGKQTTTGNAIIDSPVVTAKP